MSYTITVLTTTQGAELVASFLQDMGAEGVCIQDRHDLQDLLDNKLQFYWDYIDDALMQETDTVRVVGYYSEQPSVVALRELGDRLVFARTQMPVDMGLLQVSVGESTHDNEWYDNWKAFYHPIKVGDITIVPAWQEANGAITVKINPCQAFGTGEHESTQMCLDLLQTISVTGKQIVDVGCGSGILGIAALKMGANHAYFADIDEDAMRNMQENAALNGVENYTQRTANLLADCPVVADVMFANITADILIQLSKSIRPYVSEGGYVIVSGVIDSRYEEVSSHFVEQHFAIVDSRAMKDWRALLLQKE